MSQIGHLLDAIVTAWTKCLPPPYGSGEYSAMPDNQTKCNFFVHDVSKQMGYDKFSGLRANEMVDLMNTSTDWIIVPGATAQESANKGSLVVAGWKNPDPTESGHVCVVMPGTCVGSSKWGIPDNFPTVPKVANVSRPELCRIDRGANWAFGKDMPRYYGYKFTM